MIIPQPADLLSRLIQFNTTNPPGDEEACIHFIRDLLQEAGLDVTLLAKDPTRPNLITRLKGRGEASPLLVYGHVDVVTTAGQDWDIPPFEGRIEDDWVWGRGALDMKGGITMMIIALLRMIEQNITPPGDIILAIVVDEEVVGAMGAGYLVEEHAHLFEGVRHAIGEFGGFTFWMRGIPFYPIMLSEKVGCKLRVTLRGPAGHGSIPIRDGAMAQLGAFLTDLNRNHTPVHITPVTRDMFETLAAHIPFPAGLIIKQLLNPALSNSVLNLLGEQGRSLNPLLRNTASPTILHGSDKDNVIPGTVSVDLDGRLLPGFTPDDLIRELHGITDQPIQVEVLAYEPHSGVDDRTLYPVLASIIKEQIPEGIPTPLLLAAVTDGRHFTKLGIQTYGFMPMKLPEGFNFTATIHAANERIPVEALEFGTQAMFKAYQRFG